MSATEAVPLGTLLPCTCTGPSTWRSQSAGDIRVAGLPGRWVPGQVRSTNWFSDPQTRSYRNRSSADPAGQCSPGDRSGPDAVGARTRATPTSMRRTRHPGTATDRVGDHRDEAAGGARPSRESILPERAHRSVDGPRSRHNPDLDRLAVTAHHHSHRDPCCRREHPRRRHGSRPGEVQQSLPVQYRGRILRGSGVRPRSNPHRRTDRRALVAAMCAEQSVLDDRDGAHPIEPQ